MEKVTVIGGGLFDMPCLALPNYLGVTMTPSNPILHTTRLRTLFSDYAQGAVYPKIRSFTGSGTCPPPAFCLPAMRSISGF